MLKFIICLCTNSRQNFCAVLLCNLRACNVVQKANRRKRSIIQSYIYMRTCELQEYITVNTFANVFSLQPSYCQSEDFNSCVDEFHTKIHIYSMLYFRYLRKTCEKKCFTKRIQDYRTFLECWKSWNKWIFFTDVPSRKKSMKRCIQYKCWEGDLN